MAWYSFLHPTLSTAEDARSRCRDLGIIFLLFMAFQAASIVLVWYRNELVLPLWAALFDIVLLSLVAGWLWLRQSRVAASILLVYSTLGLIVTVLNLAGLTQYAGKNIIFTALLTYLGIEAVRAAWAYTPRKK
jgi:predicted PurR-regulated permease PerM